MDSLTKDTQGLSLSAGSLGHYLTKAFWWLWGTLSWGGGYEAAFPFRPILVHNKPNRSVRQCFLGDYRQSTAQSAGLPRSDAELGLVRGPHVVVRHLRLQFAHVFE